MEIRRSAALALIATAFTLSGFADQPALREGPLHCVIPGLRGQRSRSVELTNRGTATIPKGATIHIGINTQEAAVVLAEDLKPGVKRTFKDALPGSEQQGWTCAAVVATPKTEK